LSGNGYWSNPSGTGNIPHETAIDHLANRKIVLLGESHDNAAHHRWQLATITALHATGNPLVIGFEMFPRKAQPVLDEWVRGALSEKEFLEKVEWNRVWQFNPSLYMPIFHFARQHRLPMVALNVDHSLIREVRKEGWANVAIEKREGVSDPAAPSAAYAKMLTNIYNQHASSKEETSEKTQAISRFIDAQLTWDRAMAEAAAAAAQNSNLVAIIGAGHLINGYGVPHQLRALGQSDLAVAIPFNEQNDCDEVTPMFADLIFGVDTFERPAKAHRPLLGVMLDDKEGAVRVGKVLDDSVAKATGIKKDDKILKAAGLAIKNNQDLIAVVQRQAPGTWLPLTIRRGKKVIDLVAKFPTLEDLKKKAHKSQHK